MNKRMTGRYIGYLLLLEAAMLLPSVLVGIIYGEYDAIKALLLTAGICLAAGGGLFVLCRNCKPGMYAREGFVIAGLGWLLLSVFGALPFWISGEIPHYIDAFFEMASGFTTTGASILRNVEEMSYSLLFWRSFSHWLGGVGVLAFLLTLVRAQKGSGFTMHLLRAETPGPQVGKIVPKMQQNVRVLYTVYFVLSAVNLLLLLLGGMPLFDAFCTMFGTAGTGGFGIKADSMAAYSPYIQVVTTIFMALFGVNFSLYFLLSRKQWKAVLKDEELRLYVGVMLASIVLIVINIWPQMQSGGVLHAFFTVSSVMTTTGFSTMDYNVWPQFSHTLLLILMVMGCMAGSTGGGIKISRVLIVLKSIRAGLHRLLHPRSVKPVRMNGKALDEGVVNNVYFFLCTYMAIMIISFLVVSLDNMSLETNLSAVLACLNNIGPGFEMVGPAVNFANYSYLSKIVLAANMLIGRLEIFPILLLLTPGTWRKKS